jgi:anti-anti-sigma factor
MPASVTDGSPSLSRVTRENPPPPFFLSSRRFETGGSIRLILAGELDLAAHPTFQAALDSARADSDRVLLDLSALTFIDGDALAIIFAAAERLHREGAALILVEPRGQVRRVLSLLNLPPAVSVLTEGSPPDGAGAEETPR